MRPATGRLASAVKANAPITKPTARSPESSGPRTYRGSTGSTAPTAVSESSVTTKMPAKAANGERGLMRSRPRPRGAELGTLDLPARRLGQLGGELDDARE